MGEVLGTWLFSAVATVAEPRPSARRSAKPRQNSNHKTNLQLPLTMSCLGVHFALTKAEIEKLKSFDDDSDRLDYLQCEIESIIALSPDLLLGSFRA